jgi:hypothetical protein
MKISIDQIKATVYGIISRENEAEERIPEMKDKIEEILHSEK